MNEKNLKNLTRNQLKILSENFGQKKFTADYIYSFIHIKGVCDISRITPLSADFRNKLKENGFFISSLEIIKQQTDPDQTSKILFRSENTHFETVVMNDKARITVCLSTQAGCKMGCSFCATGQIGFERNLETAEILDQVYKVSQIHHRIDNVVFMGMGEPFDNYRNVISACQILTSKKGLNLGQRHITISTCGIPEKIKKFADLKMQFRLALSLHAPDDMTRKKIMPIAKKYPLDRIIQALRYYQKKTSRRITFEYCLIENINDSPACAEKLAKIIKNIKANINLIEFNPYPGCRFKPSSKQTVNKFAEILKNNGIEVVIRYRRGRKINAACGQLGADQLKKT
jgi:23S rRNA (adenine2503-C2)-methyltransferase